MAGYKVFLKPSAVKDIDEIPKKDRKRIFQRVMSLSENPRPVGCEKLATEERYRIRQGVYRIIYSIHDSEFMVFIVKVAHRRDVYR